MSSIARGTVIAERYVISEVVKPWLDEYPEVGNVSIALDAILDQPVIVYTADRAHSGDLLDAGRRRALLTDPRIPAVVDVGSTDDLDYVVCERTGAIPLGTLLERGPVPQAFARAFVGELATALEHAAKRGLHHLCLGPESVGLTTAGEVAVLGVAIDAAVADEPYGLELGQLSTLDARREDSLSIMRIYYALLTGYWPAEAARGGLPPAPRKNNRFVRVAEVTPGIDQDVEQFVTGVVAGLEPGPRSPSEIVRFLGDWETEALRSLPVPEPAAPEAEASPEQVLADPATPVLSHAVEAGPAPALRHETSGTRPSTAHGTRPSRAGAEAKPKATDAQLQAAWRRILTSRTGASGLAAGVTGETRERYRDQMEMRRASTFPVAGSTIDEIADGIEEWQPEHTYEAYASYASREADANLTVPILDREATLSAPTPPVAAPVVPVSEPVDEAVETSLEDSGEDEDSDDNWFLGGVFTTQEQRQAEQAAVYERERRLLIETERRLERERTARPTVREQSRTRPTPASSKVRIASPDRDTGRGSAGAAAVGGVAIAGAAGAGDSAAASSAVPSSASPAAGVAPSGPVTSGGAPSGTAGSSTAAGNGSFVDRDGIPQDAPTGIVPQVPEAAHSTTPTSASGPDSARGLAAGATVGTAGAAAGTAGSVSQDGWHTPPPPEPAGAHTAAGTSAVMGTGAALAAGGPGSTPIDDEELTRTAAFQAVTGPNPLVTEEEEKKLPGLAVVLALLVVVVVVIGGAFLWRPWESTTAAGADPTAEASAEGDVSPSEPAETATAEEKPDPEIASVSALDPDGDGSENDDEAELVLPGTEGSWTTDRYNSAQFGGLKSGLGLEIELEDTTEVSAITVKSPNAGGTFEIRTGDDPSDGETIAQDSFSDGDTTVELDEPTELDSFYLWITELPADTEGADYRARVAEVEVE